MTLAECVMYLKVTYPQQLILLPTFNYSLNDFTPQAGPKYLFRGENDFYNATKSYYQRILENNEFSTEQLKQIQKIVLDLSVILLEKFFPCVESTDDLMYHSTVLEMSGFMQHYGIPILFIDFTSDIEIAAYFANLNNIKKRGKIAVLSREVLPNGINILDLTKSQAERPRKQKAYTLRAYDNTDLKNVEANLGLEIKWYDFELSDSDSCFGYDNLLDVKNDSIAEEIRKFLTSCSYDEPRIRDYFFERMEQLD